MAKIDRVKDLPEWFDLEKYRGSESFGATEWYFHLETRRGIHFFFNFMKNHLKQNISIFLDTPVQSKGYATVSPRTELEALRDRPLNLEGGKGLLWQHWPDDLEKVNVLKDLTFCDLFIQKFSDQEGRELGDLKARRWNALLLTTSSDIPEEIYELPIGVMAGTCSNVAKPILVDLGASDRALKQAFSDWLKIARRESEYLRPKRPMPPFNRWSRYGLLPYIDLLIWSIETGNNIPDRVMSEAISHYDPGESNMRKRTATLAVELMRDLSDLQALAAIETALKAPDYPEAFDH